MKKTVLLYNFSKSRIRTVRNALSPMGCLVKSVDKVDYKQPVGFLTGVDGIRPNETKNVSESFSDEMMVMCGFGGEMIDVVIAALKKSGIGKIDLKAVVTPTNAHWDSIKLHDEIRAEHYSMTEL